MAVAVDGTLYTFGVGPATGRKLENDEVQALPRTMDLNRVLTGERIVRFHQIRAGSSHIFFVVDVTPHAEAPAEVPARNNEGEQNAEEMPADSAETLG